MSYDISMVDADGSVLPTAFPEQGGTYAIGGPSECDLNVTYNYSVFYYAHLDKDEGVRWLFGKKGSECVDRLKAAVAAMEALDSSAHAPDWNGYGVQPDIAGGYWDPTVGNALVPLRAFLKWSEEHPEGIFRGD